MSRPKEHFMDDRRPILDGIHGPEDVRSLKTEDLYRLAGEIRRTIIDVVSENGGHLASNLGVVELTLALHAEFDSPVDKIIWDVGHQCYTHKLLTGRKDRFHTLRLDKGLSGFPKRCESPHDIIETGHSSTSISSALGLRVGQELMDRQGKVVAVIGDGALTAGMALEALNHAGHLGKDLIVILNDNNMSISENVGAISSYLSRITTTKMYQDLRYRIDNAVKNVPRYGSRLMDLLTRLKRGVKAIFFRETLFSDLGFDYIGPLDGHDIPLLREVFRNIKTLNRPVVIHVFTKKGKGYIHAEDNPTAFHGVAPFCVDDGKIEKLPTVSFTERLSQALLRIGRRDERVVAITAAMAKGTGLSQFQSAFPRRFFDVGITEQHAVTFAAGLAAAGLKPVVAIYSTFMQRAVDQVIHDVALPGHPVVFAVDRAGLVGDDGETHQGLYDIPLFRAVPNLTIMAPASGAEIELMLEYAMEQPGPIVVRYPKADCGHDYPVLSLPLEQGRGVFVRRKAGGILILSLGGLLSQVEEASILLSRRGIDTDIYNMRFVKPLDGDYLKSVLSGYETVLFAEDGARLGGIGEYVASLIREWDLPLTYNYIGAPDRFIPQASRAELLAVCGLDGQGIADAMLDLVSGTRVPVLRQSLKRAAG
jgi:1-deoxy-D-xylulose-5-phosphate synthase